MEPEFKILEVYTSNDPNKQPHPFVFKIKWVQSQEEAYINFDTIKVRYPHILLDFLIARMKPRSALTSQPANEGGGKQQRKDRDKKEKKMGANSMATEE